MRISAGNLAKVRTAIEIDIIKKRPLTVFNIGRTIFSETLSILKRTLAERSVLLFSIKKVRKMVNCTGQLSLKKLRI